MMGGRRLWMWSHMFEGPSLGHGIERDVLYMKTEVDNRHMYCIAT